MPPVEAVALRGGGRLDSTRVTPAIAIGLVVAGLTAVLAVAIVHFNLRRARSRARAASIPDPAVREILTCIDRAGEASSDARVLLRPARAAADDHQSQRPGMSRLGGVPDLPPGSPWPRGAAGVPARFLAQVRLDGPSVPKPFQGRLVGVFADGDSIVLTSVVDPVRPTARPASNGSGAPEGASGPREVRALEPIRLPRATTDAEDHDPRAPYDPRFLLGRVTGLRQLVARAAPDAERILPYVLVPGLETFEIDTSHVCLLGDDPELIQSKHAVRCGACTASGSFLFQLGDVLGLHGDGPVVYVYGCAQHVDQVQAFVDVH